MRKLLKDAEKVRQGDVLIVLMSKNPESQFETEEEKVVVARGEKHGHAHLLDGNIVEVNPDNVSWLDELTKDVTFDQLFVVEDATLRHVIEKDESPTGDHGDLDVPDGPVVTISQREHRPGLKEWKVSNWE